MSSFDASPLPRRGEVFFDVRGDSRSMRLSWYGDAGVAVFSIWQGDHCTGTFRVPVTDLPRMVAALRSGPPQAADYPTQDPVADAVPPAREPPAYEPPSAEPPAYEPPSAEPPAYASAPYGLSYQPPADQPYYEPPPYPAPPNEPPAYEPLSYEQPHYEPPAYQPLSYEQPADEPPAYEPPSWEPPAYEPPSWEPRYLAADLPEAVTDGLGSVPPGSVPPGSGSNNSGSSDSGSYGPDSYPAWPAPDLDWNSSSPGWPED